MRLFYCMTEQQSEATATELGIIMGQNFLVMFMIASAVGFTLSSIGILSVTSDIYKFTVVFSAVWGAAGAGYAWKRERNDIELPALFRDMLNTVGVKDDSKNLMARSCHYMARNFNRHLFIPGVKTPKFS